MFGGRSGRSVVVALCLTSFGPLSLGLSCSGIFYPKLSVDLGVSVGLLSYYMSAVWIAALVTLPLLSRLFVRIGPRVCVTAACLLISIDFVALSFTGGLVWFVACGLVMGIGAAMLLFLAPSTLVNRWFTKRAGALLGVVMAFTGVGGIVWCAIGGACIELWGWQVTYRLFGALSLAFGAVPAAMLVRDVPVPSTKGEMVDASEEASFGSTGAGMTEDASGPKASVVSFDPAHLNGRGRVRHLDIHRHPYLAYRGEDGVEVPAAPVSQLPPDVARRIARLRDRSVGRRAATATARRIAARRSATAESSERPLPTEMGVPAHQALPSGLLLLIADISFILNFGMYLYFVIPSFASSVSAALAFPLLGAVASSIAMAGQTASKIVLGFVGDRAPSAGTAAGIVIGLMGMAILWFCADWPALVLLGSFLFGAYCGVANVMMPIFTRLGFGMRDFPRIYARVSMAASLGAIVSGFLWGTVIGATGGYAELFVGVATLLVLALWLVAVLSRRLSSPDSD